MGPRLFSRGNDSRLRYPGYGVRLQWGRDSSVAEIQPWEDLR